MDEVVDGACSTFKVGVSCRLEVQAHSTRVRVWLYNSDLGLNLPLYTCRDNNIIVILLLLLLSAGSMRPRSPHVLYNWYM